MSSAIICDKCSKAMYADSRSDKDAYAKVTIEYCRDTSWLHLCKKCYRRFAMEYFGFTEEEFREEYGLSMDDEDEGELNTDSSKLDNKNDDLISRAEALEFKVSRGMFEDGTMYVPCGEVKDYLRKLSPAQPGQIKGHWYFSNIDFVTHCSACGQSEWRGYIPTPEETTKWMPICPKCGARMEVKE